MILTLSWTACSNSKLLISKAKKEKEFFYHDSYLNTLNEYLNKQQDFIENNYDALLDTEKENRQELLRFNIIEATIAGIDYSDLYIKNEAYLTLYEFDGIICLGNIWKNSSSYGAIIPYDLDNYQEPYSGYDGKVFHFIWKYYNTYEDKYKNGTCLMKLTFIKHPTAIAYELRMLAEEDRELVFRGYIDGIENFENDLKKCLKHIPDFLYYDEEQAILNYKDNTPAFLLNDEEYEATMDSARAIVDQFIEFMRDEKYEEALDFYLKEQGSFFVALERSTENFEFHDEFIIPMLFEYKDKEIAYKEAINILETNQLLAEAVIGFSEGNNIPSHYIDLLLYLEALYNEVGRYEDALAITDTMLNYVAYKNENQALVCYMKANIYKLMGNNESALKSAEKAVSILKKLKQQKGKLYNDCLEIITRIKGKSRFF